MNAGCLQFGGTGFNCPDESPENIFHLQIDFRKMFAVPRVETGKYFFNKQTISKIACIPFTKNPENIFYCKCFRENNFPEKSGNLIFIRTKNHPGIPANPAFLRRDLISGP